jgi:hypothetical protein
MRITEDVVVLDPGRLEPGRLEPGRLEPGRLEPGLNGNEDLEDVYNLSVNNK